MPLELSETRLNKGIAREIAVVTEANHRTPPNTPPRTRRVHRPRQFSRRTRGAVPLGGPELAPKINSSSPPEPPRRPRVLLII